MLIIFTEDNSNTLFGIYNDANTKHLIGFKYKAIDFIEYDKICMIIKL
jgi:hypothetical protein